MESATKSTRPSRKSIVIGILLILLGGLAILAPFFAGIAASLFFGSLILLGGIAHLVYAWAERGAGAIFWEILIGLLYIAAALYMLLHPVGGVIALTLVLACYIAFEGIFEIASFFRLRRLPGTIWFLVDGLISILVAGLIFFHWPSSSEWAVGTLLGVSFLMSGVARFTMPMRRRRSLIGIS